MTKEEFLLYEKIVRAKIVLEGAKMSHSTMCSADDGYGPCTCGADAINVKIQIALRELR